jgi:hypothetical protein
MAKIGQIAVWVDDLDTAMKDYTDIFGMNFLVTESEWLNMRVGQSDEGLVLCTKIDPSRPVPVEDIWNKPILGMEIQVDDIEVTRKSLEERGTLPSYYLEAAGGMKEYFTHRFHGIPLTVFQMESTSWLEATYGDSDQPQVTVRWIDPPDGPTP